MKRIAIAMTAFCLAAGAVMGETNRASAIADALLTNEILSVTLGGVDAGLSVTDRRTGRRWHSENPAGLLVPIAMSRIGQSIVATMVNRVTLATNRVTLAFAAANELTMSIYGEGEMEDVLAFPAPFATATGDRLIVPMQEGMGFPVDEMHPGLGRLEMYSGSGLCMSFFGVAEDVSGAGWLCIVETPDDAAMDAKRTGGFLTAGLVWVAQKGRFGYERRARFVFLDGGGHVAMAKRYRAYAKECGNLVTFREKVKKTPQVDTLLGAANVWFWGDDATMVKTIREMQDAGMSRLLWSIGGGCVGELRQMTNVLVSCYDVYQDVYTPEQTRKLGRVGTNADAWPRDIVWKGPSSNEWQRAWAVKAPDGTWTHCAMMCDSCAPLYARRKTGADLAKKPYNCRFVDVTTAAPWRECWNPSHPMTRTQSRMHRQELLRLISEEFHLVVGSETGHDAMVSCCDYFEGMMSIVPYRVPESGRNIRQVWTNAPAVTAKYEVGEKYSLPLWELVYHDCCVAHWYWGDYNNKLLDVWKKRDLFNALYATPPMFLLDADSWYKNKNRIVESYMAGAPQAHDTGYSEMIDHRVLTDDRSVQQTVFANGISVTVNFGDRPWTMPNGIVVLPLSFIRK